MDRTARAPCDRATQAVLLRYIAVRPEVTKEDAANAPCGLCGDLLTRLELQVKEHRVEVIACTVCGWHTRRIDGLLSDRHDLLDLKTSDRRRDRGADAVSWYRPGVYSSAER